MNLELAIKCEPYEVVQLIVSNEPWTGNQMSYEVVQLIDSNEPWTGNQMSYEVV